MPCRDTWKSALGRRTEDKNHATEGPPRLVRGVAGYTWLLLLGALLMALVPASTASAQACPAGQRCYYVPPQMPIPTNYSGVGWDLIISSSIGTATGTYRFGSETPVGFTATPGSPTVVTMSATQGVSSDYATTETRGVFIESDQDVFVAARMIVGPWQSSASVKESSFALGTRFRAGGYALDRLNTPNTGHDTLSVYAPSGATVTFEAPPGITGDYWQGSTGTTRIVSLAAGETFVIRTRAANACDDDIDGALVTATAPIAVLSGGRGWAGSCTIPGGCGDEGLDNILPTTQWGTTFTVFNYIGPDASGEDVRVVADVDNTVVSVNGTSVATLNAGETHTFVPPAGASLIETSQPAAVYQNAAQNGCELGTSFVPPTEFRSSTSLNVAVNVSGTGQAAVTTETTRVADLRLDGAVLIAPTLNLVPGRPDLTIVSFSVPGGDHVISSSGDFQLGLVTGVSGTGLFAFYNPFRVPGCGNGQLDAGEGCDDGDVANGDGCNSNCRIEIGTGPCMVDTQCVAGGVCDMGGICRECVADTDCNDANTCTVDTCLLNACVFTSETQGTMCAGGVCDGAATNPSCVGCIDTLGGTMTDLGCTAGSPQCVMVGMAFVCQGCTANADCDDGNECTTNTCDTGSCTFPPIAEGTSCSGGVCNGSVTIPECVACVDDAGAGAVDSGCSAGTPLCDRAQAPPVCVACLGASDCSAGDICLAGACATPGLTYSGPTGEIGTTSTTPSGSATNLAIGTAITVTVVGDGGPFMCSTFVTASGWTCATDAITGLTPGESYVATALSTVDGVAISAMGSFSVGECADASADDACTGGTCQGTSGPLACCTGCWDGSACQTGDTAIACGAAGSACVACDDSNECSVDACSAGTCDSSGGESVGTSCDGGAGVCNGLGGISAECITCISGTGTPDVGCADPLGVCDDSTAGGVCVQCVDNSDCPSGVLCVGTTCAMPQLFVGGPSGTIDATATAPSGTAVEIPNGTTVSVVVTDGSGAMQTCTAMVMAGAWACAADSITGLVPGGAYTMTASTMLAGETISAMGMFDVSDCAGIAAGDACSATGTAGTCQGTGGSLTCCTGCWDGLACQTGDTVAACGAAGTACAMCDDSNDCSVDTCAAGSCDNSGAVAAGTACNSDAGVCDGQGGASAQCVACLADTVGGQDTGCDTTAPVCDTSGVLPVCVSCEDNMTSPAADNGCMAPTAFCAVGAGAPVCVECELDTQCAPGQVCTTAGSCATGCNDDADCVGLTDTPVCDTSASACVECGSDADCVGVLECGGGGMCGFPDSDGDLIPDDVDLDDDNDGIPDVTEGRGSDPSADTDGDGVPDYNDPDVVTCTDADVDGQCDEIPTTLDVDGDGIPNHLDTDADGDMLLDIIEAGGVDSDNDGLVDGFVDGNGDGLDDALAVTPLRPEDFDVDSDNEPDFLDPFEAVTPDMGVATPDGGVVAPDSGTTAVGRGSLSGGALCTATRTGGTPVPAGLAFLALGAVLALRRRQR